MSINLPATPAGESPRGVRVTRQCLNVTRDCLRPPHSTRAATRTSGTATAFSLGPTDDDTDVAAVRDGYVSITPLMFDLTDRAALGRLRDEWEGGSGKSEVGRE